MSRQEMKMDRYQEIKRQLDLKIPIIQISQNVRCSERTVRQIRDGEMPSPDSPKEITGPLWSEEVNWSEILENVINGHPFKFNWSEYASEKVGYKAFLDQFHKKFPYYKTTIVIHRHFEAGERCEVDYAGDVIEWTDIKSGEVFKSSVFIGILGFSQRIFADATHDQKGVNFVSSHVRMYKFFEGVPRITVPDCLKQGVTRCHQYDPEINKSYKAMSQDFNTVIVPARPRKPKDKALVEGAVKILMRFFKWKYRKHMFTSLREINDALLTCSNEINKKPHTRFKISRDESWRERELSVLQQLPEGDYECAQFKTVSVHPDSHVVFEEDFYSVPHQYRGERVDLRITDQKIEVFLELKRIALHPRVRSRNGAYNTQLDHLPENARAYLEATPQNILSQAKFISSDLAGLIDELFKENTLGHFRRVQGLVRVSRKELDLLGAARGRENIRKSIEVMRRYNKVRVPYFQELLKKNRTEILGESKKDEMKVNRQSNPNLRYEGGAQLDLVINNT